MCKNKTFYARLLNPDEMRNFTQCKTYREISPGGNLINGGSNWQISGGLIQKIQIDEEELNCPAKRTIVLPIKYRSVHDAMGTCQSMAEKGKYLSLDTFEDWLELRHLYLNNPAIQKYCGHAGRFLLWLPYEGFAVAKGGKPGTYNMTHYDSTTPYNMTEAWREGSPRMVGHFCISARLGWEANSSWLNKNCDSTINWDSAPCSACSLHASVQKNTVFKIRGLCERSEFDQEYTLVNDEATGLPMYIGARHSIISYDESLNQWNMSVVTSPGMGGVCYSDLSSLVMGVRTWTITGDIGCSTQQYSAQLSLSTCKGRHSVLDIVLYLYV